MRWCPTCRIILTRAWTLILLQRCVEISSGVLNSLENTLLVIYGRWVEWNYLIVSTEMAGPKRHQQCAEILFQEIAWTTLHRWSDSFLFLSICPCCDNDVNYVYVPFTDKYSDFIDANRIEDADNRLKTLNKLVNQKLIDSTITYIQNTYWKHVMIWSRQVEELYPDSASAAQNSGELFVCQCVSVSFVWWDMSLCLDSAFRINICEFIFTQICSCQ